MSDIFTKEKRSSIMATVRAVNTKPELAIRKFLFSQGFRYRKNVTFLPGKPDIVLSKYKTVIFVNGCYWHGHKNCESAKLPKSNIEYWQNKIDSNVARDRKNIEQLMKLGWNVITIWECEMKNMKICTKLISQIVK